MATTKHASPIVIAEVLLDAEECQTCGVIYGLSRDFIAARHRDGNWWWCPNGHRWHYSETEVQRLRKENERIKERLAAEQGWSSKLSDNLNIERKSHAATKGQLTKTRKRIEAGVCPECRRHFVNIERHMVSKHGIENQEPGFVVSETL